MLLVQETLGLNSDSTECCPVPGLRHLLAVGAYELDEATNTRRGGIWLKALRARRAEQHDDELTVDQKGVQACIPTVAQDSTQHSKQQVPSATKAQGAMVLEETCSIDPPGVFDLKWQPWICSSSTATQQPTALLGAALADGSLRLYQVSSQSLQLQQVSSCQACSPGSMALSLDWQQLASHAASQSNESGGSSSSSSSSSAGHWEVAVSGSAGDLAIVRAREGGLQLLLRWEAHDLEAWCVAHNRQDCSILYSGSDDCTFKAWDTRAATLAAEASASALPSSPPDEPQGDGSRQQGALTDADTQEQAGTSASNLIVCHKCLADRQVFVAPVGAEVPVCAYTNRKTHGAGVCTISPHPWIPHVLATGSYDERVRIWDTRMLTRPVLVKEVPAAGGVWRLRWHPTRHDTLLAACMYGGFQIFSCSNSNTTLGQAGGDDIAAEPGDAGGPLVPEEVDASRTFAALGDVETYTGHGSIAYGADWFYPGIFPAEDAGAAQRFRLDAGRDIVATASFYDRLLHVWCPAQLS